MTAVVFCGPTISAEAVRNVLPDADCRPPAAQGDVFAAIGARPEVIAIIDGVFLDVPAVWHREILAAIEEGIPVVGAASMGALRAAECGVFGMKGFGKVHRAYVQGHYPPYPEDFEDDDEVAVTHGPPELGSPPLSDAMVDLRETLARAEAHGLIDAATRDRLALGMKALFFPERSFKRMVGMAVDGMGAEPAARLADGLARHRCSQKHEDAVTMLSILADAMPEAPKIGWRGERTVDWVRFTTAAAPALTPAERRALTALDQDPVLARRIERRAAARLIALEAAVEGDAARLLGEFRLERGLTSRAALDRWVEAQSMEPRDVTRLMADEAALEALARSLGRDRLAALMLDELRLDGHFPRFAEDGS